MIQHRTILTVAMMLAWSVAALCQETPVPDAASTEEPAEAEPIAVPDEALPFFKDGVLDVDAAVDHYEDLYRSKQIDRDTAERAGVDVEAIDGESGATISNLNAEEMTSLREMLES